MAILASAHVIVLTGNCVQFEGKSMESRFVVLCRWRCITVCLAAPIQIDAYSHLYQVPFLRIFWIFIDCFCVLGGIVIVATCPKRLVEGFGTRRFPFSCCLTEGYHGR